MIGLPAGNLSAQTEDPAAAELLENFFRDNEQASESDAQVFLENLENYRSNPLDLNRASREDLIGLHVLNELQVESFLTYRTQLGPLLNDYELQAIPDWSPADIRRMLLFSKVYTGLDTRNIKIMRGLYEGENDLLLRWGRPEPTNYPDTVEGGDSGFAIRYRHSFDNRLRFGFTAEKDPGEAFFRKSNKQGFDFYSAHFFVQNLNEHLKTFAAGDYSARFGQGLLLQTGFSPGKSAETVSVARGGRKISPYASFGETFFFRGAAATFRWGPHIETTVLYSSRRRDGNVIAPDPTDQEFQEIIFSSLQSSGYHRTRTEIDDEKSLREQVTGFSAAYLWKSGHITVNGLYLHYDKPWNPAPAAYRLYTFRGQDLGAYSLDYAWRRRNWLFLGETARSDNGAVASINSLLFSPDRHVTVTALHRFFPKDYQSIYAQPFAESSGAANEQGVYLGADIRYIRRWQINVYADVWRHPWLRFGVSAPSQGREFLARVLWTKSKTFSVYALWQSEIKERNSDEEGIPGLLENRRDRLRLHAIYKVHPSVELRSRIEWTVFRVADFARTKGFIAYQEVVFRSTGSPWSASARYAIFDTDNFDTRVFAFENDLFSAVSIPAFSGRGTRYYLNLQWRVNSWLRLEGRFEQTDQVKSITTSGLTGRERYWKLQARFSF
ncbi:MAG: helix-hairpin-helix domain-containing protein [Saprospiraceae bacterium]|nr:helix-hairpin-helix domain-containing protein [Saprospiraceae bacterium]